MLRTRDLSSQLLDLTAALLVGTCTLVPPVLGQSTSTTPSDCSGYASIPLPAEAERVPASKTPPSCASYRSYRGIGRPVDYSQARVCAWRERLAQKADLGQNPKETIAWVVGGSLILADIYVNGAGVKRNIPLAMRFACESEKGMAMLALREIEKFKSSSPAHLRFEFCDYAATTFTMNFCSAYKSQIEDDRRSRYYNSLKSSMTPEQKVTFERLLAAEDAYINAHAFEVDQGGSIRVVRTISSQGILKDSFYAEVVHFERKKWPALSDKQTTWADTLLHEECQAKLQQLQARAKEDAYPGSVTAEDLSRVERAWETYRDAWVAFARLRYPGAVAAIRAGITLDRYRLLKTIE